jgi:hypothetical protein
LEYENNKSKKDHESDNRKGEEEMAHKLKVMTEFAELTDKEN